MSQNTFFLILFLFFPQLCFSAFENAFKYQYLYFKPAHSVNFSHIIPYGMPSFSQSQFQFFSISGSKPYQSFLSTGGDKLYRETILEIIIEYPVGKGYSLGPALQGCSVLIKNYPDLFAFSTGFNLSRVDSNYHYSIAMKNLWQAGDLKTDLPQIFRFDLVYHLKNHQFHASLSKDMLYPPELNFIWDFTLASNLKIKMGILSGTSEIIGGITFQVKKYTPGIIFLLHPQLGFSYGASLAFH